MSTIVVFVCVIVGASYYWLWRNRVLDKPWTTQGTAVDPRGDIGSISGSTKTALVLFLAVVTSLFSLFISAYFMRMALDDWQPVSEPRLLWINTALLIFASISIHWSGRAAAREEVFTVKLTLIATGVFSGAFVLGQLIAWQQLNNTGYYLRSNPANAFFYLFTGVHALHLLGGLWVWLKAVFRVFSGVELQAVRLTVELCRTYWHFLLVVWFVIFGLLLNS